MVSKYPPYRVTVGKIALDEDGFRVNGCCVSLVKIIEDYYVMAGRISSAVVMLPI